MKVQEWSEQLLELANIATTQPHANLMPHSLHLGMGMCKSIVKNLSRTFTKFLQESCKNLGKIITRFMARISNNHARSKQDSCKIVAKFLQELSKML